MCPWDTQQVASEREKVKRSDPNMFSPVLTHPLPFAEGRQVARSEKKNKKNRGKEKGRGKRNQGRHSKR